MSTPVAWNIVRGEPRTIWTGALPGPQSAAPQVASPYTPVVVQAQGISAFRRRRGYGLPAALHPDRPAGPDAPVAPARRPPQAAPRLDLPARGSTGRTAVGRFAGAFGPDAGRVATTVEPWPGNGGTGDAAGTDRHRPALLARRAGRPAAQAGPCLPAGRAARGTAVRRTAGPFGPGADRAPAQAAWRARTGAVGTAAGTGQRLALALAHDRRRPAETARAPLGAVGTPAGSSADPAAPLVDRQGRPAAAPRRAAVAPAIPPEAVNILPWPWHATLGGQPRRRGHALFPSALPPEPAPVQPHPWLPLLGAQPRRRGRFLVPSALPPSSPPVQTHPWQSLRGGQPRRRGARPWRRPRSRASRRRRRSATTRDR